MSADADLGEQIALNVAMAYRNKTPLAIRGGQSKGFLGETIAGEPLDVGGHRGVVHYEPGELVLTARAGTPLAEIEALLAEHHQMLAFEPPHYAASATLGGTIATGVSGPARPFVGAARDFVLGARIAGGRGEQLHFGGEVMKNVAGYDLARLMAGAYGTLGVLLELSLKVLPAPHTQVTRVYEHEAADAIASINRWLGRPWPITGAYWENGATYLRLAGAESAVRSAGDRLGGEIMADDTPFWRGVREHARAFFADQRALWRLSLPPAAPLLDIDGDIAIDWGGAQRWLVSDAHGATIRAAVGAHGGHASIYRGQASPRLHPLSKPLMTLHRRLKQAMDPAGILNRGRMYPEL